MLIIAKIIYKLYIMGYSKESSINSYLIGLISNAIVLLSESILKGIVLWKSDEGNKTISPLLGLWIFRG